MQTEIKQHPERSQPDQVATILHEGYLAHIGYSLAGQPYVIPMSYHYEASPDRIYLHGSPGSRLLQTLATGVPVCIEVTQLEGLVYSRSAKFHSMNYRSVVAFGQGHEIQALPEKYRILAAMLTRLFPGRQPGTDYTDGPEAHWRNTCLIEIPLSHSSAKVRQGGPNGPGDHDPFAPGSAGVVPLQASQPAWRPQLWQRPPFWVCDDREQLQFERIWSWLAAAYWSEGLTPERLALRLQHSLCFGLYHQREQIGFARLSTDYDSFAYLQDVILDPDWRGQGLGHWLIQCIQRHPVLLRARRIMLATRDAQAFYARLGFSQPAQPEQLMVLTDPLRAD